MILIFFHNLRSATQKDIEDEATLKQTLKRNEFLSGELIKRKSTIGKS